MYKRLIRPLLFRIDSEKIHDLTLDGLSRSYRLIEPFRSFFNCDHPALVQTLFGKTFSNPVGLAAGFDKYGKAVPCWSTLGFGFAEIGTITGDSQPGNPKPRLFRLPNDHALINRFGFNNHGAVRTAETLHAWGTHLKQIPIGINIGKTKVLSLEKARDDYRFSFEKLFPYADYFVVNVSSPNTPGLRELQDRSFLIDILAELQEANGPLGKRKPILVKIAPDLSLSQIDDVIRVALDAGIAGIVAANTTISRNGLSAPSELLSESGGLSGKPLRDRSTEIIRHIRHTAGDQLTIIGVGGIFCGDDAYEKIRAGASLVQIYTGLIYEGPAICRKINLRLVQLLERDGFRSVSEALGNF